MRTLGELERAVMEVLWSADGPLTARAVAQALPARALAQTTVLTVLSRLEKKGVVARNRSGRAHRYAPVASREDHVAELMRDVLGTAPDKTAALARFVGSVSDDEAAALAEALRRANNRRAAPAPPAGERAAGDPAAGDRGEVGNAGAAG